MNMRAPTQGRADPPQVVGMLIEALDAWKDGFDHDEAIPSTDLLEWFSGWRERAARALDRVSESVPQRAFAAERGDAQDVPKTLFWVAVYNVELACAGTEEGGVWYDEGGLVTDPAMYADLGVTPAACHTEDEAYAIKARMEAGLYRWNEGRRPKSSVLSYGIYEVHVLKSAVLPTSFPETPPVYE